MECQWEASVIVGSLAHGTEYELKEIIKNDLPKILLDLFLKALSMNEMKLVEAICRSLRNIFRYNKSPRHFPYEKEYLEGLLGLLSEGTSKNDAETPRTLANATEYTFILLANSCDGAEKQEKLMRQNILLPITTMIARSDPRSIEPALDLLSALTRENKEICKSVSKLRCKS